MVNTGVACPAVVTTRRIAVKSIRLIGTVAGAMLLSYAGQAHAAGDVTAKQFSAALVQIGDGNQKYLGRTPYENAVDPNANRRAGPGFEQAAMEFVEGGDGAKYIILLYMQNVDTRMNPGIGPYQVSCSSIRLNEKEAPTLVVNQKMLTRNPGDRSGNHPMFVRHQDQSALAKGVRLFTYGSQMGTDRTKTYLAATNERCEVLGANAFTKISHTMNEENNDRGAAEYTFLKMVDGKAMIAGSYFSNGDDRNTYTWTAFVDVNTLDVIVGQYNGVGMLDAISTADPTNIGRATVEKVTDDTILTCAAAGSRNRPAPSTMCSHLNVSSGELLWKDYVMKGQYSEDPYQRKYYAQPTIQSLGEGKFAVSIMESNGRGKNNNQKGSNTAHLWTADINPGTNALTLRSEIVGASVHQTHSEICVGRAGVDGKTVVGVTSASPTGLGRGFMSIVHYDAANEATPFSYDKKADSWPLNWNADSGYLSNMYGDNPGKQGRDYMHCLGNVPNPGHGVQGGFMSDVKSFFIAAIAGREPGKTKNSLFASLLPAETDVPGTPANPIAAQDVPLAPPTEAQKDAPKDSSGCACSTPGTSSGGHFLGSLALVGLAVLGVRTRRRG